MSKKIKKNTALAELNAQIKERKNKKAASKQQPIEKKVKKNKIPETAKVTPTENTSLQHSRKISRIPEIKENSNMQNTAPSELSENDKMEIEKTITENKGNDDLPDSKPVVNYTPYEQDTIKRPHSSAQIQITEEEAAQPIDAPIFQKPQQEDFDAGSRSEAPPEYIQQPPTQHIPPTPKMEGGTIASLPPAVEDISEEEAPVKKEKTPRSETQFEKKTKDVFKPKVEDDATPEEKKQRMEMLVDTLYDGYEMLHRLARHFTKISEAKLQDMEMEGKLSMDYPIEVNDSDTRTIYQIVQNYNQEVDKFMRVDKDFINKTKPSLMRICEKNGWGLSDELNLAIQVSKDVATKCSVGYQMVSSMKSMIKIASKMYMKQYGKVEENINQQTTSVPVPPPPEAPPVTQKEKESVKTPPPEDVKKEIPVENAIVINPPPNNDHNREPEEQQN